MENKLDLLNVSIEKLKERLKAHALTDDVDRTTTHIERNASNLDAHFHSLQKVNADQDTHIRAIEVDLRYANARIDQLTGKLGRSSS